jgi:hypothetical protein
MVLWHSSNLDVSPAFAIDSYTLWRRVTTSAMAQGVAEAIRFEPDAEGRVFGFRGDNVCVTREGADYVYWEFVTSMPAYGFMGYGFMAPTPSDSMSEWPAYNVFLVIANVGANSTFYASDPDSGYSVDNLSPEVPELFTAAYVAGATALHWGPNTEADLAGYRLYRGVSAGFVPAPDNLVVSEPDTGYIDPGPAGRYYKLSAVDVHGNESSYALIGPEGTLAADEGATPRLALGVVRPNPTPGDRLNAEFTLARTGAARLELLDVAGRRAVDREVGSLGVGRHRIDLLRGARLTPGLYLLRLTQGEETRVRRVVAVE